MTEAMATRNQRRRPPDDQGTWLAQASWNCVEMIYDAAVVPGLWGRAVEGLSDLFGGAAVLLHLRFPQSDDPGHSVAHRISDEFVRTYATRDVHNDPWVAWAGDLAAGEVSLVGQLIGQRAFATSQFCRDWLQPQHLLPNSAVAATILKRHERPAAAIQVFRPWGSADTSSAALALLPTLMPHLRRAIVLNEELARSERERQTAVDIIDGYPLGVIVVDTRGHVHLTNAMAKQLLSTAEGLRLEANGLSAFSPHDRDQLAELLRRASRAGGSEAGAMLLRRPRCQPPLIAIVTPLQPTAAGNPDSVEAISVYVSDPARPPALTPTHLKRLFHLSPGEASLTAALLQGQRLDEAAASLRISPQTARSRLKQIFNKVGVSRQTELLRTLLSSPLMLRSWPAYVE